MRLVVLGCAGSFPSADSAASGYLVQVQAPGADGADRTWNVLLDLGNQLGQATGAYGMPTTFFYAADGRLRHSHMGELSAASLEHGLQQLAEPRR